MEHRRNQDPGQVRRKRIEAGLKQQDLARMAGISRPHMSSIEHGRVSASAGVLKRLAEALDCSIADLMPLEPQPVGVSATAAAETEAA